MNIQIFGKAKCFDTKKAERYFKERRIKYQFVDILKYGMSRGELNSVKNAVGLDAMADPADQDYPIFQYLASADRQTAQQIGRFIEQHRGSIRGRTVRPIFGIRLRQR